LARALAEARQPAPSPAEQWKPIETAILADLKPVKPLAPAGVRFFALMSIVAVVAAAGGAVLGIAGWQALTLLQRSAVFTALAIGAGLLAFSVGRQIVPGSKLLLPPYWLVLAIGGVMAGVFASLFQPHQEPTFLATGLVCLRIGTGCAMAAALLVWLELRRGAILNPMFTGATAGALAGLGGLAVLEIFCPNPNEYHILVWHLGALLASVLGGIAIGSLVERSGWRRRAPARRN